MSFIILGAQLDVLPQVGLGTMLGRNNVVHPQRQPLLVPPTKRDDGAFVIFSCRLVPPDYLYGMVCRQLSSMAHYR
jgi:hypothetical protein